MTMLDHLIHDIKSAVSNPAEMPDTIVLGIFQNDLRLTMEGVNESGITLYDLDKAISYVRCNCTGNEIKAVVKKWGKK